jgi:replication factor A3
MPVESRFVGNAVEIVGKVNRDLSVKVLRATDMGRDGEFRILFGIV